MAALRAVHIAPALAFAATIAPALAQTPPTTQGNKDADDEIVVLAPSSESRIDRQTYTLRQDAAAQSTNMFDVLGRIPSVSVAPSGAVTLLGASDVTIQINGQPVPGANLEQVLRGLPGAQVQRIEVITNPSAQFSAQASGGIINIITKDAFDSGLNGSLQAGADSFGGSSIALSPSWTRGSWSLSGQFGAYRGEQDSAFTRTRRLLPSGVREIESGESPFEYDGAYAGGLRASYKLDERQRLSLTLGGGDFGSKQQQATTLRNDAGPLSSRRLASENSGDYRNGVFEYRSEDGRKVTKLNLALNSFANSTANLNGSFPVSGPPTQYVAANAIESTDGSLKLDLERPLSGERFLTLGGALDMGEQINGNGIIAIAGPGPAPFDAELRGLRQTLAIYATYQFDTGDWTWLPGVRVEDYRREVRSAGAETDSHDLRTFPSLHIRRKLGERFNIDLSTTGRIQRPGFGQLDPAVRFFSVDRAYSGNPLLLPTTTDAYEAKLDYRKGEYSASLTLFDRISDDVVSTQTVLTPDGVFLTRPRNVGDSEHRGLQVLMRGPLSPRWRYSVSGNAFSRDYNVLRGAAIERRRDLEYDGNAQLDFRDADQNAVGADQVQFDLRFQGPRHALQSESDAFVLGNVTWRRRLTERVFAVLSANDVFDSTDQRTDVTTSDYLERTEFRSAGTNVRIALTWQFGANPPPADAQPQDAPPAPGPP